MMTLPLMVIYAVLTAALPFGLLYMAWRWLRAYEGRSASNAAAQLMQQQTAAIQRLEERLDDLAAEQSRIAEHQEFLARVMAPKTSDKSLGTR